MIRRKDDCDPFREIHDLLRSKSFDLALEKVLDSSTNSIRAPFDADKNHAWYIVGDVFYKRQEFMKAFEAFQKSVDDRPDDDEAYLAIGNCCFEMEDPGEAERWFRGGLGQRETPALQYNLGNALFDQKKYGEAIYWYNRISKDDGDIYERAQKNIKRSRIALKKKRDS